MKWQKSMFFMAAVSLGSAVFAGNTVTNIRKNVVNVKDNSSSINTGISYDKKGAGITGNGKIVSDTRKVGAFSSVIVKGAFDVEIDCSLNNQSGVTVSADSNIIDLIKTTNKGGLLTITSVKSYSSQNSVKLKITSQGLRALYLEGTCDVKVLNMKINIFKFFSKGSCKTVISGQSISLLRATLEGASELNAGKLTCGKIEMYTSGSSEALVYATELLRVKATGSSEVKYLGRPSKIIKNVLEAASLEAAKKN